MEEGCGIRWECYVTFVYVAMRLLVFILAILFVSFCSYDIILTSETVYSRKSYDKLHDVMYQLLSERGAVYPLTMPPSCMAFISKYQLFTIMHHLMYALSDSSNFDSITLFSPPLLSPPSTSNLIFPNFMYLCLVACKQQIITTVEYR